MLIHRKEGWQDVGRQLHAIFQASSGSLVMTIGYLKRYVEKEPPAMSVLSGKVPGSLSDVCHRSALERGSSSMDAISFSVQIWGMNC